MQQTILEQNLTWSSSSLVICRTTELLLFAIPAGRSRVKLLVWWGASFRENRAAFVKMLAESARAVPGTCLQYTKPVERRTVGKRHQLMAMFAFRASQK